MPGGYIPRLQTWKGNVGFGREHENDVPLGLERTKRRKKNPESCSLKGLYFLSFFLTLHESYVPDHLHLHDDSVLAQAISILTRYSLSS